MGQGLGDLNIVFQHDPTLAKLTIQNMARLFLELVPELFPELFPDVVVQLFKFEFLYIYIYNIYNTYNNIYIIT